MLGLGQPDQGGQQPETLPWGGPQLGTQVSVVSSLSPGQRKDGLTVLAGSEDSGPGRGDQGTQHRSEKAPGTCGS